MDRIVHGKPSSSGVGIARFGQPYDAKYCPACGIPFADNVMMVYTHLQGCCKELVDEKV